ncbi:hypothetical protein Ddye_027824 [Dipteronia dyeriana]|uniref:Uncharacterized protein n=1 Tax=Dipteronia dyeriana TaxID=168575 RepID=A0AAD9TPU4_9ROSI|nr:hypothetical protein Ddye_027824 [Dipteronia dyeriana]
MTEHPPSSSKVRKLNPALFTGLSPTAVEFNVSMKKKIKKTNRYLEVLCKEITELGLNNIPGRSSTADYQRPFSASVPTESTIYGRDEDKAKILDMVFSDEPTDANFSCPSLTCLSSRVELLAVIKHLEISGCPKLVTLSSSGQLPETLQHLNVVDCPKLVSIAESFHSNMSLEYIKIWRCKKLKLIPGNLNSLSCLRDIYLWDCPSLVSFPEGGLPDTNLRLFSIDKCRQLRALPQHMHRLNSLRELELRQCPSITSIEEEGLPTSLTSLSIADVSIYRPLIEWGLHKLTSLKNLEIRGCVYAESFPQEETGLALPTSVTGLTIARFPKLKYLSSTGLQNLSSLEYLSIRSTSLNSQMQYINNEIAVVKVSDDLLNSQEFALNGGPNLNTGTLAALRPPAFVFFVNDAKLFSETYRVTGNVKMLGVFWAAYRTLASLARRDRKSALPATT